MNEEKIILAKLVSGLVREDIEYYQKNGYHQSWNVNEILKKVEIIRAEVALEGIEEKGVLPWEAT